ncbi:MAG: DUF192 domain-containing protein [Cyanobacteriota bacterium]|nr:DUF192 domain-containing protein [Cyanobacteriota bacterium]
MKINQRIALGIYIGLSLLFFMYTGLKITASIDSKKAQNLPVEAQAIISEKIIYLEVPKTPSEKAKGLMYRKFLHLNTGMLFTFNPPQEVKFWMKNCLMHLDIIFLKNGRVKAIAHNAPPCLAELCVVYSSKNPVTHVIEIRGGRAMELGLAVGDEIDIIINNE